MKSELDLVEALKDATSLNTNQIKNLLRIVQVLNRYYNATNYSEKSKSQLFREKLLILPVEDIKEIKVKQLGTYEYVINATLSDGDTESWVHIDGIAEEREHLKSRNISEHPVFQITCLEDIVNNRIEVLV